MALTSEVGLRVVFSPISSKIVVRAACCTVGTVLPVYSTFKAVENNNRTEQQKWLLYWTVYGSFTVAEVFSDKILSWFPLYYHAKFAFLVWLQLPSTNGAKHLYTSHLRPLLLRHQAKLDRVLEFIYSELTKTISAHQAEIQFARALFVKVMSLVNQMVRDFMHPVPTPRNRSIDGPRHEDPSDTQTNSED